MLTMSKCGHETISSNATTNSFVESKRLNFSEKKCHRLHVGNVKRGECQQIKVHDKKMDDSKSEKYVGDIVCDDGKADNNIASRKAKGFAIAGDILAILDEVPLGTHRIEAGLHMRNGMLLNGILTNSEVWVGLKEQHFKELEQVDEHLLRGILKAHSKTPIESLYLETGSVPIRYIIKKRRINYLHHLLTRDSDELISKVYIAQIRRPGKNDWAAQVEKDIEEILLNLSNSEIMVMKKEKFKSYLGKKIHLSAFNYLKEVQETHTKVKKSHTKLLRLHHI